MPNVLASMDKERNTKASKITGIESMLPLLLTPLDNCLTVVEAVGVLDGGLKENFTNLQEGVSKGGFIMIYMRIYTLTLRKPLEILLPLLIRPHKRTSTINSSIRERFPVRDTVNIMINRVILILLITLKKRIRKKNVH